MFNPDTVIHLFATFAGMPPDTDTPPVCGSTLTEAYDRAPREPRRPYCYRCDLAKRRLERGLPAVPAAGWRNL